MSHWFKFLLPHLLILHLWDERGVSEERSQHVKLTASNWRKKSSGLSSILSGSACTFTIGLRFCARSREALARFWPWAVTGTKNWARHDSSDTWKTPRQGAHSWMRLLLQLLLLLCSHNRSPFRLNTHRQVLIYDHKYQLSYFYSTFPSCSVREQGTRRQKCATFIIKSSQSS